MHCRGCLEIKLTCAPIVPEQALFAEVVLQREADVAGDAVAEVAGEEVEVVRHTLLWEFDMYAEGLRG